VRTKTTSDLYRRPHRVRVSKSQRDQFRLKETAYHEAGHAVISLELGCAVRAASIVPNDDSLGRVTSARLPKWFRPDLEASPRIKRLIEIEVSVLLAGNAAQRRLTGRNNWRGARGDLEAVGTLVSYMFPHETVLKRYVAFKLAEIEQMVASPCSWAQIEGLANALLEHRELKPEQIRNICFACVKAAAGVNN
jgi:Peptidase family M41